MEKGKIEKGKEVSRRAVMLGFAAAALPVENAQARSARRNLELQATANDSSDVAATDRDDIPTAEDSASGDAEQKKVTPDTTPSADAPSASVEAAVYRSEDDDK